MWNIKALASLAINLLKNNPRFAVLIAIIGFLFFVFYGALALASDGDMIFVMYIVLALCAFGIILTLLFKLFE